MSIRHSVPIIALSFIYILAKFPIVYTQQYPAYACTNGECHTSNHAFLNKIDVNETIYTSPPQIEEYHFHVYFFQDDTISVNAARWIQQQLIQKVMNHKFLVVLVGINDTILPDLNTSAVPVFNEGPVWLHLYLYLILSLNTTIHIFIQRGPHPCGSYEVWTPAQYFHLVLSWFMMNRGDLTILLHPLTDHAYEDHIGRSMWLGPRYRLNFAGLPADEGVDGDPPQYPELELGYNYDPNSKYAPNNWLSS